MKISSMTRAPFRSLWLIYNLLLTELENDTGRSAEIALIQLRSYILITKPGQNVISLEESYRNFGIDIEIDSAAHDQCDSSAGDAVSKNAGGAGQIYIRASQARQNMDEWCKSVELTDGETRTDCKKVGVEVRLGSDKTGI